MEVEQFIFGYAPLCKVWKNWIPLKMEKKSASKTIFTLKMNREMDTMETILVEVNICNGLNEDLYGNMLMDMIRCTQIYQTIETYKAPLPFKRHKCFQIYDQVCQLHHFDITLPYRCLKKTNEKIIHFWINYNCCIWNIFSSKRTPSDGKLCAMFGVWCLVGFVRPDF